MGGTFFNLHAEILRLPFYVTHVERIAPPERGWSGIDSLRVGSSLAVTTKQLRLKWLRLAPAVFVPDSQALWQSPNGSLWLAHKDDPFMDPRKQLVLLGLGEDPFTEEALQLYGDSLQSHFRGNIQRLIAPYW